MEMPHDRRHTDTDRRPAVDFGTTQSTDAGLTHSWFLEDEQASIELTESPDGRLTARIEDFVVDE